MSLPTLPLALLTAAFFLVGGAGSAVVAIVAFAAWTAARRLFAA